MWDSQSENVRFNALHHLDASNSFQGGVPVAVADVARHFQSNSLLKAPFGIKTVTVGVSATTGDRIVADNPVSPTAGVLTSVTIGELVNATVRAGSIGTLKVTGNTPLGLLGSITTSTVAAGVSGPQSIGTLTVAGDIVGSVFDAPAAVTTISVGGRVTTSSSGTRIQAAYNTGAKLGSRTAGAWGQAGIALTTDLVTRAVGTFALKGNAARRFVGTTDLGFIDVLGNSAGVGLGKFTGSGTSTNSLFRVSDGDVGSFTVLRFVSSDLLVGFRPVTGSDLTLAPAAANWAATNHKIGAFATTAAFDSADPDASASFADSIAVAAVLGTVTISGLDPADPTARTFGVAFRTGAGAGAKGTVKKGGVTLAVGAVDGQFNYLGLPGRNRLEGIGVARDRPDLSAMPRSRRRLRVQVAPHPRGVHQADRRQDPG
ncbi:MAG TPA: hypothetical protein VKE40_15915 [Gemmataceae bacterium]|nr:hypothetical protein [Gemmataceae bacterium]